MHVLVTGGAGFIGSHLTERLLDAGHRVTVVDDESTGARANLAAVLDQPRLTYVQASMAEPGLLARLLTDVDQVYHLAAAVGVRLIAEDPIRTIQTNIHPTELLLETLLEVHRGGRRVKLYVASSSEVYGKNPKPRWNEDDDLVLGPTTRPRWAYGASKAIDEFLALAYWRQHRLPVVVGRFFNVVGPRQIGQYGMVLPRFIAAARAGGPLVVHADGQQVRCFAHVGDVVEAITALMEREETAGGVFNVGSDVPVTILELAQRVAAIVNPQAAIEFQSYAAAFAPDFEDVRVRVPDLSRLRAAIGDRPRRDLDAIIRELAGK